MVASIANHDVNELIEKGEKILPQKFYKKKSFGRPKTLLCEPLQN